MDNRDRAYLVGMIFVLIWAIFFFVDALFLNFKTVEIGPNLPYTWQWDQNLSAEGNIYLKSNKTITVVKTTDGLYVTSTSAGEIPAGEKMPIFSGVFEAIEDETYTTSSQVNIYSDETMKVQISWHPMWNLVFFVLAILLEVVLANFWKDD